MKKKTEWHYQFKINSSLFVNVNYDIFFFYSFHKLKNDVLNHARIHTLTRTENEALNAFFIAKLCDPSDQWENEPILRTSDFFSSMKKVSISLCKENYFR